MRPLFVCHDDREAAEPADGRNLKKDLGGSDRLFEENVEKTAKFIKKKAFL